MQHINYTLFIFIIIFSCQSKTERRPEKFSLPKGYSLTEVEKVFLNQDLEEISGIFWHRDSIFGIEDESSIIYLLDSETGKILKRQKFEMNKDIEDILIRNDTAWVLRSNGNLYRVANYFTDSSSTIITDFPRKEKRDFEAIASTSKEPILYVFCKVCEWDGSPEKASVFRFSIESMEFDAEPYQIIHQSKLKALLPNKWKEVKIQPSAAAFHPFTGELYLISSTDKWLMTLDSDWNPTSFHKLNPSLFRQPEGITFDETGNLYISNEASTGTANWLLFPYQK